MNSKNTKNGIIIGVIVCALVLVGFLGSYAYFLNTPTVKNQSVTVQTGNLALVFEDGNAGFEKSLEFGESAEKTFTVENTGTLEATFSILWKNILNSYIEGSLTYTLEESDSEDGTYTELVTNKNVPTSEEKTDKALMSGIMISPNEKKYYKLTITLNYLDDIDQTPDLNASLNTEFKIVEGDYKEPSKADQVLAKLGLEAKSSEGLNFAEPATTNETEDGLYTLEDDYGTSYFYRGAVENNYVKFGDFYWRIIRINGDGSLRMIYDGTRAHANGASDVNRLALTNIAWNAQYNDAKYEGYMYSPSGTTASTSKEEAQTNTANSNIKTQLESWYKTNIADKGLDGYVSDSIFCNDRSTPGKETTGYTSDTGLGYGNNATAYGARARLINGDTWAPRPNTIPSFVCLNKNDAFTKSDTEKGNGALSQKVGLITADEVSTAGGIAGTNNTSYYLYKGNWYWSLSPYHTDTNGFATIFFVNANGNLNNDFANATGGVAPVISLSPEYVLRMVGDGTIGNEYRVE